MEIVDAIEERNTSRLIRALRRQGADDHRHPIVQSFVIPNDPEEAFPPGGILPDAYYGAPDTS